MNWKINNDKFILKKDTQRSACGGFARNKRAQRILSLAIGQSLNKEQINQGGPRGIGYKPSSNQRKGWEPGVLHLSETQTELSRGAQPHSNTPLKYFTPNSQ